MSDDPTSVPPVAGAAAALKTAVLEIEAHVATDGWDQQARIYALVPTRQLLASQPGLASMMGLDRDASAEDLTPVEQEELAPGAQVEEVLATIEWPDTVLGAAVCLERLVLPPDVEASIPEDPAEALEFARNHPDAQEVRLVAAATRSGEAWAALRMRSHDDEMSVVDGTDLVPGLVDMIRTTLDSDESGTPSGTQEQA